MNTQMPRPAWLILSCIGCAIVVVGSCGGCFGRAILDGSYGPLWPGLDAPPAEERWRLS